MRTEFVELIDCAIRIPAEAHEPLRAAIGEIFQWREFEDVEQALSVYDLLVVEYDEVDAIVGLERDPTDDSWRGDELYALLAPHVDSDNYLVFRYLTYDGEIVGWKIVFDGQGSYRHLRAETIYVED
jgi:hypothetical protein